MNRHYKLPGFIVSVVIHGGLLMILLWQQSFHVARELKVTTVPLNMEMFDITKSVQAPEEPQVAREPPVDIIPEPQDVSEAVRSAPKVKRKTVIKKHKPRPVTRPSDLVKPQPVLVPRTPQSPRQPVIVDTTKPPALSSDELDRIRERYKRELLEVIVAHKYYPRRARKRHIEGRVEVGFVVLASGEISNLRLVSSSGKTSLDKAALEALRRAARFEPLPKELGLSSWDFVVPLDYRLL